MKTQKTSTRESLLVAANHVLRTRGINQLTLDAVAQQAGVSKGGLIYHFASKDTLIEGMVDYYLQHFEQRLNAHLKIDNENPERAWLRAYLAATFESDNDENEASAALLAAIAVNPTLLQPMRARYEEWQARFARAMPDPAVGTLVRLALDGLWTTDLFGLAPPDPALREKLHTLLLALLEGSRS